MSRIRDELVAIDREHETLLAASRRFGDAFAGDVFLDAARSEEPEDRVDVAAVERGHDLIVNLIVGVIDAGLDEAAERSLSDVDATHSRWERLVALGVASKLQAGRLRDAVALRNRLRHAYVDVGAEQLHAGTGDLLERYPEYLGVLRRLVELIERED